MSNHADPEQHSYLLVVHFTPKTYKDLTHIQNSEVIHVCTFGLMAAFFPPSPLFNYVLQKLASRQNLSPT